MNDMSTQKFINTLSEYGLVQHVKTPTHVRGHLLDVVITRECTKILKHPPTVDESFICDSRGMSYSDHKGINTVLCVSKPPRERKTVSSRNYKKMNIDNFKSDLNFPSENVLHTSPLNDLVNIYNDCVRNAVEKNAPLRTQNIVLRPNTEWYSNELLQAKREKRKAERTWRLSCLAVHKEIFKDKCLQYSAFLTQSKRDYFSSKIIESGNDSKQQFSIANQLTGKKSEIVLPICDNESNLSDKFADFFESKILGIRTALVQHNNEQYGIQDALWADKNFVGSPLREFSRTSPDEVLKIVLKTAPKFCELDPMPTNILKTCIENVLPIITCLVNKSLTEGVFPEDFKQAIVKPLLKKPSLDKKCLKNYRPVSNLSYVSKIIEKVVAKRIEDHLTSNTLHDNLQSAYRAVHSTETALLRVHHDIAVSLDKGCCATDA
ncbi:uncharacterized protein LOC134249071 [Saccostrea cucullata]|uniref:uncharacterized protein LOC134249071 n=1 Tax=Saccostrea cuccullata TaxID=36930 RepID=UPI002ED50682